MQPAYSGRAILRSKGGPFVSIVRVGLSETKKFAEGYDAIFGKRSAKSDKAKKPRPAAKSKAKKKPARKK
jgi:hypothetical protein